MTLCWLEDKKYSRCVIMRLSSLLCVCCIILLLGKVTLLAYAQEYSVFDSSNDSKITVIGKEKSYWAVKATPSAPSTVYSPLSGTVVATYVHSESLWNYPHIVISTHNGFLLYITGIVSSLGLGDSVFSGTDIGMTKQNTDMTIGVYDSHTSKWINPRLYMAEYLPPPRVQLSKIYYQRHSNTPYVEFNTHIPNQTHVLRFVLTVSDAERQTSIHDSSKSGNEEALDATSLPEYQSYMVHYFNSASFHVTRSDIVLLTRTVYAREGGVLCYSDISVCTVEIPDIDLNNGYYIASLTLHASPIHHKTIRFGLTASSFID